MDCRNLDAIKTVSYRVNSKETVSFKWTSQVLKERDGGLGNTENNIEHTFGGKPGIFTLV
jgi:hypothetical protein